MTIADYATLVIAIATVVYSVGSILLWHTTHKALALSVQQSRQMDRRLQSFIYSYMVTTHRDLSRSILQDPSLRGILEDAESVSRYDLTRVFLGTWLINHASQLFYQYENGNLDPQVWPGVVLDIRDMFGLPFVGERWAAIRQAHSDGFRRFVAEAVLGEVPQGAP